MGGTFVVRVKQRTGPLVGEWGGWGITRPTQARSQENKETPCIRKRKQLCT